MQLTLEGIGRKAGAATHLYPLDLALRPGEVTVLLGATQSGKNSRMRLMAGFDKPTEGRMRVDGVDITGMLVRERKVASLRRR